MSTYKRKRGAGPSQGVMSVYVKPASYKRRRADGPYYSPGRPGPSIRVRRGYVNRTPGGQITAENRYFDATSGSLNFGTVTTAWTGAEVDPATLLSLFAPIQGDDISNRQGRKVFVKKIRITGILQIGDTGPVAAIREPGMMRIVIYQDTQTNGAQAAATDVFSSGTASNAISMFQNLSNLGRFKVLKDKTYCPQFPPLTGVTASLWNGGVTVPFKFTVKPMCYVNYNSTNGGTIADVIDNSFHVLAIQNINNAATIVYKARTVFTA